MNFQRKQSVGQAISPKRVLIIYGPRRVGKTTLLKEYLDSQIGSKILSVVGDDLRLRELFSTSDRGKLLDFALPYEIFAIDEAQQVPNIGLGIKMIVDACPEKQIILTGSSSFDLQNQIGEPLTGRHFTMILLPVALTEFIGSNYDKQAMLEERLIFGNYPEVLLANGKEMKIRILNELVSSYLYKDVLALEKIKSPDTLRDLARAIALKVGGEVSYNELAELLRVDVKTVARYLDLLEKMFVIKQVRGFSRNLRNEIAKKAKYYFLDNGVRNAIIGQYNSINERTDVGALWENYIFMELYKQSILTDKITDQYYFWRTHTGQEIDIIRERAGELTAYECKFSAEADAPKLWSLTYPDSSFKVINQSNYLDVIGGN